MRLTAYAKLALQHRFDTLSSNAAEYSDGLGLGSKVVEVA